MKEKKPFIFGLIVGITLIVIGLMVNTNYYSILILAMGFSFGFSSIVQLLSLLILDFVLALLRVKAWVIGMIFILFILQWVINSIVYHYLERRQ